MKIGIIGLGLIGGSLFKSLKKDFDIIAVSKSQNGENIDPRFMQAMMMNSMMSDIDFTGNNNNNR